MRIKQKRGRAFQPDSIAAYFRLEWLPLTLITLSGLAYNVGLLAGPWFEGRLAQCLLGPRGHWGHSDAFDSLLLARNPGEGKAR